MLVGDQTAAMLGLNVRHRALVSALHRLLATALRAVQIVISPFAQPFQPMPPLAARLGLRVVDYLCLETTTASRGRSRFRHSGGERRRRGTGVQSAHRGTSS